MSDRDDRFKRGDPREHARRDLQRWRRRDEHGWWRSLSLLGSVGWPVVGLALGGAFAGRALDGHYETGVRFTLMLLVLGTVLGSVFAYRTLRGGGGA
jgi:predicted F0F1-ATPase subunit